MKLKCGAGQPVVDSSQQPLRPAERAREYLKWGEDEVSSNVTFTTTEWCHVIMGFWQLMWSRCLPDTSFGYHVTRQCPQYGQEWRSPSKLFSPPSHRSKATYLVS